MEAAFQSALPVQGRYERHSGVNRTAGLSVCICTSGRPAELERCLASVRDGSEQPAAVHVSDDGRSTAIASLAATYGAQYAAGPSRGLCANRNAVIALTTTSHITLIDDDGVFGPNFIRDATALLPTLGPREMVCGTVVERSGPIGPTTATYLGFFAGTTPEEATCFNLNANVIPRTAFDVARFDERIVYGYEDMDLAAKLLASGYGITYMPHLANYHLPPRDPVVTQQRERQSERARYLVALKRRSYRYARPGVAQASYALVAAAHSVAHAAARRRSPLEPIRDIAYAAWAARRPER